MSMFGSPRPFSKQAPRFSGTWPWRGMPNLGAMAGNNPNPAAQVQTPQYGMATAEGVQKAALFGRLLKRSMMTPSPADMPPAPGGPTAIPSGQPAQQDPATQDPALTQPPTPPVLDQPAPLPANPRVGPPRPPEPGDAVQQATLNSLLEQGQAPSLDSPMDDLHDQLMGVGGKIAEFSPEAIENVGGFAESLRDLFESYLPKSMRRHKDKEASQYQPERSATGESRGLAYKHKPDHYAKGQEAWESVAGYFKGGDPKKRQPNPFLGKHAAGGWKGASFAPERRETESIRSGPDSVEPAPAFSQEGVISGTAQSVQRVLDNTALPAPTSEKRSDDFVIGFLGHCRMNGMTDAQIKQAIDRSAAICGEESAAMLCAALEKQAAVPFLGAIGNAARQGAGWASRQAGRVAPRLPSFKPQWFGTKPATSIAGKTWTSSAPGLGGNFGASAMGGLMGGYSGYMNDQDPGWSWANAAQGTASFNPYLHRMLGRGGVGGRMAQAYLRGHAGGIMGQSLGHMADTASGIVMGADPHLRDLGLWAGRLGGASTGGAHAMAALPRGTLGNFGRAADFRMRGLTRGMNDFYQGTWEGGRALAQPAMNFVRHGNWTSSMPAASTQMRRVGQLAGIGTLGAGAMSMGMNRVQNAATQATENTIGRLAPDMVNMADQYMMSRGMMDPNTGQFSPLGTMSQLLPNIDKLIMPHIDGMIGRTGIDPATLSSTQKKMLFGGALAGGLGVLGGHPLMAGMGGAAAMYGGAPLLGQMLQRQPQMGYGQQLGNAYQTGVSPG